MVSWAKIPCQTGKNNNSGTRSILKSLSSNISVLFYKINYQQFTNYCILYQVLQLSQDNKPILLHIRSAMGYWKGSGLAILLDMIVALLSGGLTTSDIGKLEEEHALSQLFVAFDLDQLTEKESRQRIIKSVLESVINCDPKDPDQKVYYPGQQTWMIRTENTISGIPVNRVTWNTITGLLQ